jgi:hypothetical protein
MNKSLDSRVEYVRSHRSLFLGQNPEPNLPDLACALACDALCLQAYPVFIDKIEDWYVVHAELDWIKIETKLSVELSFHRVQVFHQHRQNSTRANIIITAFSQEVITVGTDGCLVIKGDATLLSSFALNLQHKYPRHRVVAFRGLDP